MLQISATVTNGCKPLMDDFAKQDWVKEKYPNLKFEEVSKNSERTYAVDQIKSGKTTVDLFISCSSGADSFEKQGFQRQSLFRGSDGRVRERSSG